MKIDDFPLISVVVPCFKHAQFLTEGVESIVHQTYPHTEIIIVNDGSPDDTSAVAHALMRRYRGHRIRLVEKPNGGLADARNAGIAVATGDWIMPFDADDVYESTFIAKAVDALRVDPTRNLIYTDVQSFGAKTELWCPEDYNFKILVDHNIIPGPSIYRKELWLRAGGYERALPWGAEDYSFWLACGKLGLKPYRVPGALFKYRQHPEGSMLSRMLPRWRTVEAMVRSIHCALYPPEMMVFGYHRFIAEMDSETVELLLKKDQRFDDLAFTFLWRGLKLEHEQSYAAAIEQFEMFEKRFFRPDWQPVWHKLVCQVHLGHWSEVPRLLDALPSSLQQARGLGEVIARIRARSHEAGSREMR